MRQPWAWAIIHGQKDVENRTRNIAGGYRGPVAIHAGLVPDLDAGLEPGPLAHALDGTRRALGWGYIAPWATMGAVVGVVDLVDVHPDCSENVEGYGYTPTCSPWAFSGHHHICLANPRPLARPIPAKGRLGLWRPDETLAAAIREQVSL